MRLARTSRAVLAACALTATVAAGCGEEKTDISPAVTSFNAQFRSQGVELDCPKEVEGDTFTCDLKGTRSGKSAKLDMKLVGEDKDTIDVADEKQYAKALEEVGAGE